MKFEDWLQCPHCDEPDPGVVIESRDEYVEMRCRYCGSSEAVHRDYVEWIEDA